MPVIATRRTARVRYEVRFGTREMVVAGVASCVIAGLIFTAGVLVGRERGAGGRGPPRAEAPREAGRPEAGGPHRPPPVKTGTLSDEKLTFYKTLTAPTTSDLPPVGKPRIEERMVPRDEPVVPAASASSEPAPAAPPPAVRSAPAGAEPVSRGRAPGASRSVRVVPPPRPAAPHAVATTPAAATDAEAWTVQVSAFRSRVLADELRVRLAARGFDAYVLASGAEDGRARYRVRVGAYATRGEAERVAADLRSERGLNPIVTSRVR
jgi:cell division protein FtsN